MKRNLQLQKALELLKKYGAKITTYKNKFIVEDNHIWGFIENQKPMVMSANDIIDMAKQYTDFE